MTPTETGVWAIAAVFAALASMFRDFGVGEYLIQEKELTSDKLRAAFGVNILVSWCVALLLFGTSGVVSAFYGEPGVGQVMRVQSINFALVPFGAVTLAWFRRALDWRPIFWASVLSNITSMSVAVALAFAGFGFMSLAYSSLAGVVVSVTVASIARPRSLPWLPTLRGMRRVLHSGTHLTSVYLVGQLGKSAPDMIIGKALGIAPLGFFSRASALGELFNRLVIRCALPVCLPYFAREAREGKDIREGYLRAMSYLTVIGWPSFLFLGAMAHPAIRILYGPQWMASVPLARILCAAAALGVTYLLATEVLIARGENAVANSLQAVTQSARVVGVLAGLPFGLEGTCLGLVAASVIGTYVSYRALDARIGLTFAQTASACLPSLLIAIVSAAPAVAITAWTSIDEHNYAYVMAVAVASFVLLWLAGLRFAGHPLWNEFRMLTARWRASAQRA